MSAAIGAGGADEPLTREHVATEAKRLGFTFPVAVDRNWKTLRQWWLNSPDREWTSVTFLIDRAGRIQFIHPGGSYAEGDAAYKALDKELMLAIQQK